jgi:hypothetical protein
MDYGSCGMWTMWYVCGIYTLGGPGGGGVGGGGEREIPQLGHLS